jgi:iron complex transport system ATP-binding protein
VLTARFRFGVNDTAGTEAARGWLREFDCSTFVDRDVRRLSRGERQRVAVATALAQDTALVLLDEPIAHQDPRHQTLVLQRLAASGRTLVASMHDINAAARFASHVLLLSGDGAWTAGRVDEVMTADRLGALFGTDIEILQRRDGGQVFVTAARGNAGRGPGPL